MSTCNLGFDRRYLRAVAVLFPLFVALSLTAYFGLTIVFDFPDVLRRGPEQILEIFSANEDAVRGFYYIFSVSHLILALGVLLSLKALAPGEGPWLLAATAGGVLYGIAQTAGFLRWPMLVPAFADKLREPGLAGADQDLTLLVLDAFHRYTGVAIGENLSFWGMGLWLVGTGVALRKSGLGQGWFGVIWVLTGLMVFVYTFEQLGGAFAALAPLLLISHGIAYGLLLALAWMCWKTREGDECLAPLGWLSSLLIALFSAALIIPGVM